MADDEDPEQAESFEWDDEDLPSGNSAHLARHNIRPQEVEELWANEAPLFPNKSWGSGDWQMIGTTHSGRALTIVFSYDSVRRCIRAFTGWDSSQGEIARRDRRQR